MGRRSKNRPAITRTTHQPEAIRSVNQVDLSVHTQELIPRCKVCFTDEDLIGIYCRGCWIKNWIKKQSRRCGECGGTAYKPRQLCDSCHWNSQHRLCGVCLKSEVSEAGQTCYLCQNSGKCQICTQQRFLILEGVCEGCVDFHSDLTLEQLQSWSSSIKAERFRSRKK